MKITRVRYGMLVSDKQDYSNRGMELEAEVDKGEDWQEVLAELKRRVREGLHGKPIPGAPHTCRRGEFFAPDKLPAFTKAIVTSLKDACGELLDKSSE